MGFLYFYYRRFSLFGPRQSQTIHVFFGYGIPLVRSLIFYLGTAIAAFVIATIGFFTFPFPLHYRYLFITLWSRFVVWWAKKICGIRYQVIGKENIPKQNAIVLSNHQSAWETIFFQTLFPQQTWVLKKESLRIPFWGWALALLNPIAIDRKRHVSAIRQLIRQGRRHLAEGHWVIVFPEGSRTPAGVKREFTIGGAALAAVSGYLVVPVAHNAGEFWPPRRFIKKCGTVKLVIGSMIDSKEHTVHEINDIARSWIQETKQQLSPYQENLY